MESFTFRTLINKHGHHIEKVLGLTEQDLEQEYSEYLKVQPKGTPKDFMWGLFNRMLLESAGDYIIQSGIYHAMAVFVSMYEGKNGNQYARLALAQEVNRSQTELKEASTNLIWELEIIADPNCDHAQSLDGVRFPITDDLVLPLANENCTREFCRCTTSRVPKRDDKGRIVLRNKPNIQAKKKRFWEFWK